MIEDYEEYIPTYNHIDTFVQRMSKNSSEDSEHEDHIDLNLNQIALKV